MDPYSKTMQQRLEEEYREKLDLDPRYYELPEVVDPDDKEERERLGEGCYRTYIPEEDSV